VPVTIMHMHMAYIELDDAPRREKIVDVLASTPRILLFDVKAGYNSLAQIVEWARDMGRPRGDVWEVAVFSDSITLNGRELYLMYGVHQEAIVAPENVDAIRAVGKLSDKWSSIEKTDKALGIVTHGKRYG